MWSTAIGPHLRRRRTFELAMGLAVLVTAFRREAVAQVTEDPLGPIGCFEIVEDRGLAATTALDLCAAAISIAPGQCYAATLDRFGNLSNQQIVQLCRGATSIDPIDCFAYLEDSGSLTTDQAIGYCAPTCPVGPAPAQASDPGCMDAALGRAELATQMASELCRNSRSAGPVECFLAGKDVSGLAEGQLVQLCAQSRSCQYINVVPTPSE